MYRHVRQSCKIANSEEGMEKLVEHTMERQISELRAQLEAQAAAQLEQATLQTEQAALQAERAAIQNAQLAELTNLLRNQQGMQVALPSAAAAPSVSTSNALASGGVVNSGHVDTLNSVGTLNNNSNNVNNSVNNHITLNITPWDSDKRIAVTAGQIIAAFSTNPRLQEYMSFSNDDHTDPSKAPPYVTELLMDLVKLAHSDPAARNVYLNPKRADQALVHMKSGKWEIVPLEEATRRILDGVAKSMHGITMSAAESKQLPAEAQNTLAMAGLLYDEEPEEYAKRVKAPMSAHLANNERALLK
jgi:hypothetical protein